MLLRGRALMPVTALLAPAVALVVAACSPGGATPSRTVTASPSSSINCTRDQLHTFKDGRLTIATDQPAYPPFFIDDDPGNGQGFESALGYAIAGRLGFASGEVDWVKQPFTTSFAAGDKPWDFDLNQISITPGRERNVEFSQGYYDVQQAVVTLKDSRFANATTLAQLKRAEFGAQVDSTGLDYVKHDIKPTTPPVEYSDTNDAKNALEAKQVDAIVVDLPTAQQIGTEFGNIDVVGRSAPDSTDEEYGAVLQKRDPLVDCVDQALTTLRESGELQKIQDEWIPSRDVPVLE